MARTQAADYDKKRDAITRQAAKLFARQGFSAASVSELAAICDVSKSLIYHYYPSKEAILFEVMNDHMETLISAIGVDDPKTPPNAALAELTRALMRVYADAADPQKVLLYELEYLPKTERDEIVGKERRLIDRVEAVLVRAAPALSANRPLLRAKVMLYFGMLNWTHTWFKTPGPISRDDLAEMIAQSTIASLA